MQHRTHENGFHVGVLWGAMVGLLAAIGFTVALIAFMIQYGF